MPSRTLDIEQFGPIRRVQVRFGDVTVLVGPQATGKSLACQWLKLIRDRERIAATLSRYGYEVERSSEKLLSLVFGANYRNAWGPDTKVSFDASPTMPPGWPGNCVASRAPPTCSTFRRTARW